MIHGTCDDCGRGPVKLVPSDPTASKPEKLDGPLRCRDCSDREVV